MLYQLSYGIIAYRTGKQVSVKAGAKIENPFNMTNPKVVFFINRVGYLISGCLLNSLNGSKSLRYVMYVR